MRVIESSRYTQCSTPTQSRATAVRARFHAVHCREIISFVTSVTTVCGAILQGACKESVQPVLRKKNASAARARRVRPSNAPTHPRPRSLATEAPGTQNTRLIRWADVPLYSPAKPSVLQVFQRQSMGFLSAKAKAEVNFPVRARLFSL